MKLCTIKARKLLVNNRVEFIEDIALNIVNWQRTGAYLLIILNLTWREDLSMKRTEIQVSLN